MRNLFEWKENLNAHEWDTILATMQGNPLQSKQWGTAMKLALPIKDYYWAAFKNGQPIYLVRFEKESILKFFNHASVLTGPTLLNENDELTLQQDFFRKLKQKGFFICSIKPWKKTHTSSRFALWVDLTLGKEKLWENLDKKFRYDIRRAQKEGVIIEPTTNPEDISAFYKLCQSIYQRKNLLIKTEVEKMMQQLLQNSDHKKIESVLFVARYQGQLAAGAFIIRCGPHIYYHWGAVDRQYTSQRVGAAVQWGVIEWALNQKLERYDLGEVNPTHDDNLYLFKKKLGGELVPLVEKKMYFLRYQILVRVLLRLRKLF